MERVRRLESENFLWALRKQLYLPPAAVSGNWEGLLLVGGRGRLQAACALICAGAVGAFLALRFSPNSIFASKISSTIRSTPSSSRENTADGELTVPGLQNAGNNCFLNVILQALASSKAFVSFTASRVEATSKSYMKFQGTRDNESLSMPLVVSVSSLVKELSQLGGADRTLSPRTVMLALRSYVKHFDLASQQDAAEVLSLLASAIQEERDNYIQWLKSTFQTLAMSSSMVDQGFRNVGKGTFNKSEKCGDQLLESWRGNLHWPLEGTLASLLTCQQCAHEYTTQIQFFNDVSLSPVQDREGNIIHGCTLECCLEKFTGPEWINNVKCSKCSHNAAVFCIYSAFQDSKLRTSERHQCEEYVNVLKSKLKRLEECDCNDNCECEAMIRQQGGIWRDVYAKASKTLKIGRSPEVVCFQLQRVVINEDGALKKLTGHVAFPKVLDLFPFTIAAESSMGHHSTSRTRKESRDRKNLQCGCRLASEVDSCVPGKGLTLKMGLACNGGVDSGSENRNSGVESLSSPSKEHTASLSSLSADSVRSTTEKDPLKSSEVIGELSVSEQVLFSPRRPQVCAWTQLTTGEPCHFKVLHLSPFTCMQHMYAVFSSSSNCFFMQTSQWTERSFEDQTSISPTLSTNLGSILTHSPLTSSISSQLGPRVFPRQLQPSCFDIPQQKAHFSLSSRTSFGNISTTQDAPKSAKGPITRTSRYSRRLLYELVSVVVHQGGPQSGHYIVYRKMIKPTFNESLTMKEISLGQLADEQRARCTGDTYATSVCVGDPGFAMQADMDERILDLESKSRFKCGTAICIGQLLDSEEQEYLASGFTQSETTGSTELVVQKYRRESPGERKHSLETLENTGKRVTFWFRVSDTNVQRVQEQEVFGARATLLFYEQL